MSRTMHLLTGTALLLLTVSAAAHDYWLEPDGDGYLLYRGHRHSGHEGAAVVPYEPGIVQRAVCADGSGQGRTVRPGDRYPVRIPGPCSAVYVEADSGLWTQTLTGTRNLPRDQVSGALRSWRSVESVKRLEAWSPALARPVSDGLELVPTEDPFALAPGDKLRLLVTWQGRPRAGVAVAYDGRARGLTGKDGRINIRLRHRGPQSISASIDDPSAEPGTDKVVRSTALIFDLR